MNVENLITENKSSLVEGINEARRTGNGENLLKGTKDNTYWLSGSDTTDGGFTLEKGKIVTEKKANAWVRLNGVQQIKDRDKLFSEVDKKMYTLSMDIRTPEGQTADTDLGFSFRKTTAGDKFLMRAWRQLPKTEGRWKRIILSGVASDPDKIIPDCIVIGMTLSDAGVIEYRNLKIEEGTPTAWTPCKDDLVDDSGTQVITAPSYEIGEGAKIIYNEQTKTMDFVVL